MKDELNDLIDGQEIVDAENDQLDADTPIEEKEAALPPGYKTKEQLIAEGKDPSGWLPPEAFAERKERFKVESKLRREVEDMRQQMANLNKFHAQQLKIQREQLESKREDAILTGDVKEVKRLDGQIDEIKQQQAQPVEQPQKLPEEIEWEADNPWIYDQTDPRTPVAIKAYDDALRAGKTVAGALRAIDIAIRNIDVDQGKPQRKPAASAADSSRTATSKRGTEAPAVTWDSLTAQDLAVYEADPSLWGSKSDYLKVVANSRR